MCDLEGHMLRHTIVGFGVAALVVSSATFVQAKSSLAKDARTNMTLFGCLIKESDYRRAHGLGKGGLFGLKTGSDFVLVNASTKPRQYAPSGSCTEKGTGPA